MLPPPCPSSPPVRTQQSITSRGDSFPVLTELLRAKIPCSLCSRPWVFLAGDRSFPKLPPPKTRLSPRAPGIAPPIQAPVLSLCL